MGLHVGEHAGRGAAVDDSEATVVAETHGLDGHELGILPGADQGRDGVEPAEESGLQDVSGDRVGDAGFQDGLVGDHRDEVVRDAHGKADEIGLGDHAQILDDDVVVVL